MNLQRMVFCDASTLPCPSPICNDLPKFIRNTFQNVELCESHSLPASLSHEFNPDLILLRLPSLINCQKYIEVCQTRWNKTPIFSVFCGAIENEFSAYSNKLDGLDEFICCPFNECDVLFRLRKMIQQQKQITSDSSERSSLSKVQRDGLVGTSPLFLRTIEKIPYLSRSDAPILISGETGTGKELIARAIHYESLRKRKPFIPLNCGALPDHLFENELFGHAKGAYTDAAGDQKGLVAEAEGGTLFLDEVDSLSPQGQVKLLRFLQDGQYRPLGQSKAITANVRVLCATNTNLNALVEGGVFREDLYYRLNVLPLPIPPLRERIEDIPLLFKYFIALYTNDSGLQEVEFSGAAMEELMQYAWPGNVRELEALVHRSIILNSGQVIEVMDLGISSGQPKKEVGARQFQQEKNKVLGDFERIYLFNLLTKYKGNITHAAKAAGKERRSFQRLLKKHKFDRVTFAKTEPPTAMN